VQVPQVVLAPVSGTDQPYVFLFFGHVFAFVDAGAVRDTR
jgi:hypothetical protein